MAGALQILEGMVHRSPLKSKSLAEVFQPELELASDPGVVRYLEESVELLIDDTPHEEESHVEPGDVVPEDAEAEKAAADTEEKKDEAEPEKTAPEDEEKKQAEGDNEDKASEAAAEPEDKKASESVDDTAITVIVNDAPITLSGKKGYVFVDVFDHIDFDLSKPHGKMVITKKNGMRAEYSERIKDGDRIVMIEDVTTSGKSIEETYPILKAQGDITVTGLMVSLDRMELGLGGKIAALAEITEKYGFEARAIVTMAEVTEHLYNRKVCGRVVIDDDIKRSLDEYYKTYGA